MQTKEDQKGSKPSAELPNKVLASLYTDISVPAPPPAEPDTKNDEEQKLAEQDQSDEGKLKLFVGGLYFQSEGSIFGF